MFKYRHLLQNIRDQKCLSRKAGSVNSLPVAPTARIKQKQVLLWVQKKLYHCYSVWISVVVLSYTASSAFHLPSSNVQLFHKDHKLCVRFYLKNPRLWLAVTCALEFRNEQQPIALVSHQCQMLFGLVTWREDCVTSRVGGWCQRWKETTLYFQQCPRGCVFRIAALEFWEAVLRRIEAVDRRFKQRRLNSVCSCGWKYLH